MDDLDPRLIEPASPFQALMGFRMTGWGPDWARFEMPIVEAFGNRHGIIHGGIHGVMLDTVMGYAGSYTGDPADRRFAMTLSLTVNFVGQPAGDVLVAEGRRVGGGRRSFFAEGSLLDGEGGLVATGTGVFRYRGA